MRRLNLALLASAQLAGAVRQQTFSIHDDLVAYPQYEIVFSEGFISQREANSLIDRSNSHPTYSADFASQSSLSSHVRESTTDEEDDRKKAQETYEVMHLHPSKYLCSVPVLEPTAPYNETASELAKQEEARELARASAAGWELLQELDGTCLYFMSGWWSYSFCYNRQIVQFHALPMMPNGKPPVRDPSTMEFVLGRAAKTPAKQKKKQQQKDAQVVQGPGQTPAGTTDLQVKGDQRYLVQRLEGGTLCDLTNRERTIEVQYHCVPGMKGDRIAWIKEVTTCAYLMVVNTPRLCEDVAFLPPSQSTANPITCRLILDTDDPAAEAEWHRKKTLEAEALMGAKVDALREILKDPLFLEGERPNLNSDAFYKHAAINVGGVVVGGRQVLGQTDKGGMVLKPPSSYLPNKAAARKPAADKAKDEEKTTVIATKAAAEDGGKYWTLNDDELDKLDLDLDLMDQMVDEMEKQAKDRGWSLELAERKDGERELRGYLNGEGDGEDDDLPDDLTKKGKDKGEGAAKDGATGEGDAPQNQGDAPTEGDGVGSQEDFYEDDH